LKMLLLLDIVAVTLILKCYYKWLSHCSQVKGFGSVRADNWEHTIVNIDGTVEVTQPAKSRQCVWYWFWYGGELKIAVCWSVNLCNAAVSYQRFWGTCWTHFHVISNQDMEAESVAKYGIHWPDDCASHQGDNSST
jgi:hypothetical protein